MWNRKPVNGLEVDMRKSFVFYFEWAETLSEYPAEVRYEVYDAIIGYAQSGTLPELKPLAKMAFSFIKRDLDRDLGKYNSTVEKRSEAGKKGMQSRWGDRSISKTKITNDNKSNNALQPITTLTTITEDDDVNVNEDDNVDVDVVVGEKERKKEISSTMIKKKSKEKEFDFSEYTSDTMKGQQLMAALSINGEQLDTLLKEVRTRWSILDNGKHQDRTDFDMHLRNTLLKMRDSGQMAKVLAKDVKLGYGEYLRDDGTRTYGTGQVTVPLNAPPRPDSQRFWNPKKNSWDF